MSRKSENDDALMHQFNEGRMNADKKWTDAIDERIAELEKLVGIPELKRLRERTRFRWDEVEYKEVSKGIFRRKR
jgi:hypothetical protein